MATLIAFCLTSYEFIMWVDVKNSVQLFFVYLKVMFICLSCWRVVSIPCPVPFNHQNKVNFSASCVTNDIFVLSLAVPLVTGWHSSGMLGLGPHLPHLLLVLALLSS